MRIESLDTYKGILDELAQIHIILHNIHHFSISNCSMAECSWLRLAAGCAMLKICEQKGVGDVYTVEQFYNLSQLTVDDVKQVRELFVTKLHKVGKINNIFVDNKLKGVSHEAY